MYNLSMSLISTLEDVCISECPVFAISKWWDLQLAFRAPLILLLSLSTISTLLTVSLCPSSLNIISSGKSGKSAGDTQGSHSAL